MTFAACRDAQQPTPRHNHTMTKTMTNEERIKRIRAMSQEKFDAKVADLLSEIGGLSLALQTMLQDRKTKA